MKYEWNSIVKSGVLDSLVNNYDALWGPYRMCCDLEEADGTIAAASLVKLGLKQAPAVEFCSVYNCVKAYLSQHPELSPGVAQLRALMAPLSANLPVAQRNDNLVEMNAGQALGLALMCRLTGKRAIDQWLWRFDIEMPLRALVCALVPTLPLFPLILAPADFIELCHDFVLTYRPHSSVAFMAAWQQMQATARSEQALAGQTKLLNTPRLVHIQTTLSHINTQQAKAQFINHSYKQHLELKQNTAELAPEGLPEGQDPEEVPEIVACWAHSILTTLKAQITSGTPVLLSNKYCSTITANWLESIVQAGCAFLVNVDRREKYSTFSKDDICARLKPLFTVPTKLHFEQGPVKIEALKRTDLPQPLVQYFDEHFPHSSYVVQYEHSELNNPLFFSTNLDCAVLEDFQLLQIACSDLKRTIDHVHYKMFSKNYFNCGNIDWKALLSLIKSYGHQPNLPDFSFLGARGFNLADDFSGMLQFVSYLALR